MTYRDHDSDEDNLPEGMVRIGYDADDQTYTFRDADGSIWQGPPGCRYGSLTKIRGPPRPRRQTMPATVPSPARTATDFDDILPKYSEECEPGHRTVSGLGGILGSIRRRRSTTSTSARAAASNSVEVPTWVGNTSHQSLLDDKPLPSVPENVLLRDRATKLATVREDAVSAEGIVGEGSGVSKRTGSTRQAEPRSLTNVMKRKGRNGTTQRRAAPEEQNATKISRRTTM